MQMVEEHPLTIEYALTRREILRNFLRSMVESPRLLGTILLYSSAMGVLALFIRAGIMRAITAGDAIRALACAVGFLIFLPFWAFVRGKTGKRTLTVSCVGISTAIGRLTADIPWSRVRVIEDGPQFVLIARANGNAFFIPNRAFSDAEHREHFLSEVMRWKRANS